MCPVITGSIASIRPATLRLALATALWLRLPNLCNRYAYGVVYQVDCCTGMVVNVIPTYAGGYGVGQMLPSAYSYYNLPMQYRSIYYPTADYSYWYAPGRSTSMIRAQPHHVGRGADVARVHDRSAAADGL